MSSIYKKGRDGYYYYQTYVYNPATDKKDRRIFHALRTKDVNEAIEKQKKFDLKYENQVSDDRPSQNTPPISGYKRIFILSFILICIIVFFINFSNSNAINEITLSPSIDPENEKAVLIEENTSKSENQTFNLSPEKIRVDLSLEHKKEESSTLIYTVVRVEKLPGSFNQGKIYVTMDENSNLTSQKKLCHQLASTYDEFSNIVICLYADNDSGRNLASGENQLLSTMEQKRSWLAMYTYNSVEGEYFDSDPSGYLGDY